MVFADTADKNDSNATCLMGEKRIYFLTWKRGEPKHLVSAIEAVSRVKDLEYSIIAADMHLSGFFGNAIDEVKEQAGNV